jgi:PAS domain S-box-containing protein
MAELPRVRRSPSNSGIPLYPGLGLVGGVLPLVADRLLALTAVGALAELRWSHVGTGLLVGTGVILLTALGAAVLWWTRRTALAAGRSVLAPDPDGAREREKLAERLHRVLDGTQDGFWEWPDLHRQELWWSDGFFEILGYEPLEFEPTWERFEELLHPDDVELVHRRTAEILSGEDRFESEYRLRHRDGRYLRIQARGRIYRDVDGRTSAMAGSVRDVTEQRALESELKRTADHLARAQRVARIGSWEWQPATGEVTWSDGLFRVYGRDPGDGPLKPGEFLEAVHPDDQAELAEAIERSLETGIFRAEYRLRRYDGGGERTLDARGQVELGPDGQPLRHLGVVVDVTDLRSAELELRESESFLRQVVESAEQGIVALDRELRCTLWNPYMERLSGIPADDAVGQAADELQLLPVERIQEALGGAVVRSAARRYELPGTARSGWVADRFSPIRCADGEIIGVLGLVTENTREVEAVRALEESESRLRVLYESVEAGVVTQSPAGEIIHANRAAREILELDEEEVLGRTAHDPIWAMQREDGTSVAGDDHPMMVVGRTGEAVRGAVRRLYSDRGDRSKWLLINAVPRLDEAGEVVEVNATFQDITALKETEAALRTSQGWIAGILEAAPIGIGVVVNRVFQTVNDRFCAMTGYSAEELIGHSARLVYPSDDEFERVGRVKYREIAERQVGSVETRMQRRDGRVIQVLLSSTPLDPADLSAGVVFTALDISERRHAEELRRRFEERFRSVFQASPLGIALAYPEGTFAAVNPAFGRILDYDPDELVGLSPATLVFPDDPQPSASLSADTLAGRRPGFQRVTRFRRKDGSAVWCRLTTASIREPGGSVVFGLGMIEDITKQREAEEALQKSRQRLRKLYARLTRIREEERTAIARELHDVLGQQLIGLRMDLDLTRSAPSEPEALCSRLDDFVEATDQSIDLIRRLSSRLRPPILDVMGLGPALEWQVDQQRVRTEIRFHLDVPEDRIDVPKEREISLFRIAQEALTNAIRHSGASNVWVRLTERPGRVELAVEDDGVGLPPDALEDAASLGLVGMQERAVGLGGQLDIGALPAGGTVVRALVPTAHAVAHEGGST